MFRNALSIHTQRHEKQLFSVEWFTAWEDEEDFELSAKRELTLDEFTSPLQLILKDRELLRIVQKKWQ
ncbi:hypothetical protein BHY07_04215 [Bacillus subtilis subsp. subtilis]|nr:hypothetical protein BSn5_15615 [Bacillus subtilis BSn5]AHA76699.1 Hypothetical Protein U712_03755 [Bacillus subtilis PY79]AIY92031.1 hypothetical protein QU35_04225 [Bacillus subtilis subsp. subtilis str. 168]AIY96343.1 hypothetical protein QX56_04220 [Bacillus subtilis]AJE93410.1 hypothetical protein RP72_04105 [Bacillus subtilis subsp. subtilis]AKC46284.1 hypothetical protein O7A_04220 [Bacillus subtilis KCTC 1028 = ATCC 6051a]EHA29304.1 hypothetical protein BSSC8_35840 [Bacillus subtil